MRENQNGTTENTRLRQRLLETYLGQSVTIEIDRPIGYVHQKKDRTLLYPINYGYVPGVLGGDGEELDVYLLGVDQPVQTYTGRIIAAVLRADDCEDKLVMAPEGCTFSAEEIEKQLHFQEKYYQTALRLADRTETDTETETKTETDKT